MRGARAGAGVLAAALCWSCAVATVGFDPTSPTERVFAAMTALEREDYATAREHLLWLGSHCETGESGRRAVLMLAAAELDTNNPNGSPDAAAALAAHYLLVPDAPEDQRILARTLYRLAADRGGTAAGRSAALPALARRYSRCSAEVERDELPALPSVPVPTTVSLLDGLKRELAARSDSLATLEAELQRITDLLRTGTPAPAPGASR